MNRKTITCAAILLSAAVGAQLAHAADVQGPARYTFELIGGYFFGPGPVEPDTHLPNGKLRNIRFDTQKFQGYCEFANDGSRSGLLSDGRTRINQNIDAGRLLIGGGTSPILLSAVDGGPHHGTEQYYLDDQYRLVWRVDIALDPGFEEGIIHLTDFVLHTGVARVTPSLQSQQGMPGGYDQAGSLKAGDFITGRVGDFDEDGYLDGVLVAAPHVPMAADMLPGAPVANQRGFRTNVPIPAQLSTELMLRGATHLREAIEITVKERGAEAAKPLLLELQERVSLARQRAAHAIKERQWARGKGDPESTLARLDELRGGVAAAAAAAPNVAAGELASKIQALFAQLDVVVREVAAFNERSDAHLPTTLVDSREMELHPKSY